MDDAAARGGLGPGRDHLTEPEVRRLQALGRLRLRRLEQIGDHGESCPRHHADFDHAVGRDERRRLRRLREDRVDRERLRVDALHHLDAQSELLDDGDRLGERERCDRRDLDIGVWASTRVDETKAEDHAGEQQNHSERHAADGEQRRAQRECLGVALVDPLVVRIDRRRRFARSRFAGDARDARSRKCARCARRPSDSARLNRRSSRFDHERLERVGGRGRVRRS